MKQLFIENLKNGKIPAEQNRGELTKLITNGEIFCPLAENIKAELKSSTYWGSNEYFFGKLNLLTNNFSVELCEHLIQVKERLQAIPTQGFAVEGNLEITPNAVNFSQEIPKAGQYSEPDLSHYKPNSKLAGYLNLGDVSAIRAFLFAELCDFRLTIEELIQMVFFVEKNAPNVFEEYKTSAFIAPIETDETKWDGYYFNKQQGDLNQNFALERLFHLINVRETLMKKGDSQFQQIEASPIKPEQTALPKVDSQQKESSNQNTTHTTSSDQDKGSNWRVWAAIIVAGGVALITLYKLLK